MDIAILSPSPVTFAVGGAEHLWLGLQRYINEETKHSCELFKFPSLGADLQQVLESYLEPARFNLGHFDTLITGKDPAWFVEHPDHRIYLLHKLRGLYDTYHFFNEPDDERLTSAAAAAFKQKLSQLARADTGPNAARHAIESFLDALRTGEVDDREIRFPGPFARQVVHLLDHLGTSPKRVTRYAAISGTVAKRQDYFPGGVDVAVAYPPPRLTGFKNKRGEHFFTVSRLDQAKRIDIIIREFRKVRADVNLFIGGVGPALDDLNALADGDPRIIFLGKLTDSETLDYYARSIAVPFTPYDEDYGLITVEAMKSGKPVLTLSDSGGVTELVRNGENGWCVPNKEGALAKAFRSALKDPQATAEMGKTAQKSVSHITWHNVAETLLGDAIPQQVIKGRSSTPSPLRTSKGQLVVASTFGIYPPRGGGQSRIFHLYSKLAEDFDVTAVCLVASSEIYSDKVIAPNFREIRIPKTLEHEEAEANRSSLVEWVPITDIVCAELLSMTPQFGETLRDFSDADAVVASGPYLVDIVRESMPNVPFLYEAHNLEVELKRDILPKSDAGQALLDQVARMERDCWSKAQMVFACADRDIKSLNKIYGPTAAVTIEVPNGYSTNETVYTSPNDRRTLADTLDRSMRKSAMFLGSWHGPNLTAMETILRIAPLFADVRFLLIGSGCLAFKDRPIPDNVVMFGMVDEEEKSLLLASTAVALNPMTEGSGSNLKMLDYFGAGIPVISTSFGARGLDAHPSLHYIDAGDDDLTMALTQFFSVSERDDSMVERAYNLAKDHYSWEVIGSKFKEELEELLTHSTKN